MAIKAESGAHVYSAAENAFYATAFRDAYEAAGAWPADAVDVDDAVATEFMPMPKLGMERRAGADGLPTWAPRAAPTPELVKVALSVAVQAHLDWQARALGYDDIKSAATYADEPAVPQYQQEGRALRAWRSKVWCAADKLMEAALAGNAPVPAAADLVAQLPVFVAP